MRNRESKCVRVVLGFYFVISLSLTGCISRPVERAPSAHHAHAAQERGDWAEAARLWSQAIQEQKGMWKANFISDPQRLAVFYYELGRCEGALCQWEAAERDLNQALALDEKRGPVWMDLTELARLNHAHGNHARAESYFDRLFADMPEEQVMTKDPVGYSALLLEFSNTVDALGKKEKGAQLRAKAEKARSTSNAAVPKDWTPYGSHCQ